MGKPRLIILIRHAQSEGNKNRDIHQTIPDHRVKLTQEGWQQAYEAGRRLRELLRADDTLHVFTSPYRRTRETTEGILATLTSDEPEPSPFKRNNIKVWEEPRLREQDFGNFQPCSAEMERMWQERADYGHFFYRIPNGESAADAYDRVSGFNESLWRQFGDEDFASVCVLVTHGLMSRVFLMKWYHFSVEYFEDLRNVNHCEFLIMRKNEDNGKYILQNKLRTWSELKREHAEHQAKDKREDGKGGKENGKQNGTSKDVSTLTRAGTVEVRRRWGGCPNGCDHDKSFKIRQTLADLVKSDSIISNHAVGLAASESESSGSVSGGSASTAVPNSATATAATATHGITNPSFNGSANSQTLVSRRPAAKRFQAQSSDDTADSPATTPVGPQIDVTKARDEVVSSPDGTPSYISVDDRLRSRLKSPHMPPRPLDHITHLHVGRDFGGSYSGHNSGASDDAASSDEDEDDDDEHHRHGAPVTPSSTASGSVSGTTTTTTTVTMSQPPQQPPRLISTPTTSLLTAAAAHRQPLHQELSPSSHHREQSRMGRGARANRLGDYHSSDDGEHEADGEHDEADDEEDDDTGEAALGERACACEVDPRSGSAVVVAAMSVVAGEEDEEGEALRRAEEEDRSLRGSVY